MKRRRTLLVACLSLELIGCDSGNDATEESSNSATTVTDTSDDTDTSDATDTSADAAFFTSGERETILTWLGPLDPQPPPDPSNRFADDPAAATLGQKLFYDPRYSGNGQVSCSTCHSPETSFSDNRANTSEGIGFTGRSSISIINGVYGAAAEAQPVWQFWDGRTDSQWSQALGPPESDTEMGSTRTTIALLIYDEYRAEYEAIAGPMPALRDGSGAPVAPETAKPGGPEWDALDPATQDAITEVYVNFGKFIAAFERRLISHQSRFDAFWTELSDQPDSDILTPEEKEGLRVFIDKGRCLGCHGGPNFTDGQFHNIAIPQLGANIPESDPGRAEGIMSVMQSEFICTGPWSDHPNKDQCAINFVDVSKGELGAFKTPTLRNISDTAPYMHTGTFTTLEQVVRHYDTGGGAAGSFEGVRDELLRPLSLSAPERSALVAFLLTLDGEPLDPSLLSGQ
jgi:cytochrome c peroxidase